MAIPEVEEDPEAPVVTIDSEIVDAVPIEASPLIGEPATPITKAPDDYDEGFDCLLCGDAKVSHLRSGWNCFISLCGNTLIDVRGAQYEPGTKMKVFVLRLCGDSKIFVPRGTSVVVHRILLCGDRDISIEPESSSAEPWPRLTLTIITLCGNVKVRSEGLVSEDE